MTNVSVYFMALTHCFEKRYIVIKKILYLFIFYYQFQHENKVLIFATKNIFGYIFLGAHSGQPLSNWAWIHPCKYKSFDDQDPLCMNDRVKSKKSNKKMLSLSNMLKMARLHMITKTFNLQLQNCRNISLKERVSTIFNEVKV